MQHFEELREKISSRLCELQTPHRELQIRDYSWLYGALGSVPSDVMFICENPNITAIKRAHGDTIDGRAPDIEAQWWGGRKNPAAKRFRPVLCELGLKTSQADARGGWNCYITNVVKEANVAGIDQRKKTRRALHEQACAWADILTWELDKVQPHHVFCVGENAYKAVTRLQRDGLLPAFELHRMGHYSARGLEAVVLEGMLSPLRKVLGS